MLSDPQTIGSATLARTGLSSDTGVFQTADGTQSLLVRQTRAKDGTTRTVISLQDNKIAADPITAVNSRVHALVSVSVTAPPAGYTVADLRTLFTNLSGALNASTGAMLNKTLAGEK